jgi:hypothetical protein
MFLRGVKKKEKEKEEEEWDGWGCQTDLIV